MIKPCWGVSTADVAAHYDDLDRFYQEVWGEHVHHGLWTKGDERPEEATRDLVRLIAEKAEVAAGDLACDIGCAYGATARQLAEENGASVVGLTISPVQFDFAIARQLVKNPAASNIRFLLRDWHYNNLEPSFFQAVVSIECVSHINDKPKFFAEICRVLEPGRKMAVTAWLAAEAPRDWQVRHLLEPICREGRLAGLCTAGEYRHLIESAGLELLESQSLRSRVRKTWSISVRRVLARVLTRSDYRRFLLERATPNWVFFVTLWRIILAYRVRAMDYGLFVARKPALDTMRTQ